MPRQKPRTIIFPDKCAWFIDVEHLLEVKPTTFGLGYSGLTERVLVMPAIGLSVGAVSYLDDHFPKNRKLKLDFLSFSF